jgi:IstB-like ATP binding protein
MIVDTALEQALRTLKLSGMLHTLEVRLAQACAGELGHIEFLQVLCRDEIARREAEAINRRIRRAHFEQQATLEGFNFATNPKLPAAQIRDLAALRWLAAGESVALYAVTCLLGPRVLSLLFSRQVTVLAISGTPNGPSYADLVAVIDDVAHCPGLHPVGQSPPVAGLEELAETRARPPT